MAGRAAEEAGKRKKAISFYERAAVSKADPEYAQKARYRLGFLLSGEAARRDVDAYRKRFPDGEFQHALALKLAEDDMVAGHLASAMKRYSELVQSDGIEARLKATAQYGVAWCHLKQGDLAQADKWFAAVLENSDASPAARRDARLQRGEIAYDRKRVDDARRFFETVKEGSPNYGRARYMLGWCARKQDDHATAIARFREALQRAPQAAYAADARLRLAEELNRAERYADVRDMLKPELQGREKPPEELLHT